MAANADHGPASRGRANNAQKRIGSRFRTRTLLVGLETQDQLSNRGSFKQFSQRQIDLKRRRNPCVHSRRQQRMSAEGKEVVMDTNLIDAQDLTPDGRELLFDRSPRGDKACVQFRP